MQCDLWTADSVLLCPGQTALLQDSASLMSQRSSKWTGQGRGPDKPSLEPVSGPNVNLAGTFFVSARARLR